jgi:hypothetical protein
MQGYRQSYYSLCQHLSKARAAVSLPMMHRMNQPGIGYSVKAQLQIGGAGQKRQAAVTSRGLCW